MPGVFSMYQVSFPCTGCFFHAPGVLCSPQVHAPYANSAARKWRARVYKDLERGKNTFFCFKVYVL